MELTDQEILQQAAEILAASHTETGTMILAGAMLEMAQYHRTSGSGARQAWLAALEALGETCKTLAKRERGKLAGL